MYSPPPRSAGPDRPCRGSLGGGGGGGGGMVDPSGAGSACVGRVVGHCRRMLSGSLPPSPHALESVDWLGVLAFRSCLLFLACAHGRVRGGGRCGRLPSHPAARCKPRAELLIRCVLASQEFVAPENGLQLGLSHQLSWRRPASVRLCKVRPRETLALHKQLPVTPKALMKRLLSA